jgi:hypothetical protein
MEEEARFREVSPHAERFFVSGRSGGWREKLTAEQIARIEADHRQQMENFGYLT